ncbi:nucleotide exchange factor GrpE [Solwaraspora sp. WMMD406]|uniref:nucleotide exchange factor GrpE n=1 Tax=Solwaraspora sp. WMMD406 TaxID=3016095 RepID=UPI0024175CDE|nr:nucleotide exchange factor GrpE [Solwaraspora sp. WMMD406]MDG4762920.1 nucleotide exchange factor GrpE [Solwaraspora sp. WMMD406]
MTDKPRVAGPGRPVGSSGSAPDGAAPDGPAEGSAAERLVIRDRRRIDPTGTRTRNARHAAAEPVDGAASTDHRPAGRHARTSPEEERVSAQANGSHADEQVKAENGSSPSAASAGPADQPDQAGQTDAGQTAPAGRTDTADTGAVDSGQPEAPRAATEPAASDDAVVDEPVLDGEVLEPAAEPDAASAAEPTAAPGALGAELQALRGELDERTRDLQRVSAEYANYRKRVDRDKGLATEQATAAVLAALLPILDDLDRAREHGDLVGPFGTVAEQLSAALGKFGLTPFGDKGDAFDPTRHEAVAHLTSADVSEPTCVDVMRRGYLLGDRLLRAALVAVADPE